jgi:hypothetical protein
MHRPGIEPGASRIYLKQMATANFTTKPPMRTVTAVIRCCMRRLKIECNIIYKTTIWRAHATSVSILMWWDMRWGIRATSESPTKHFRTLNANLLRGFSS